MDAIFIIQQTILCAIPFLIVALAGVFAERSGIINLALDGGMIFGAFVGAITARLLIEGNRALASSQWVYLLAMAVAALAGAIFSLLLSFSAIQLKADQTIGGTALNMLAPAIVCAFGLLFFNSEKIQTFSSFMILQPADSPLSVNNNGFLGLFFDRIYISTYICIAIYILLSIWLYKSKVGTHLRACGEHPQAAASVGISVKKMRYLGTTISGALAGLGGFVYIVMSAGSTAENTVGGVGFLALAIMIFGNWNPVWIALGSILFGFLKCIGPLSSSIPFLSNIGLPLYFYNIIPYFAVIIVLIFTRKKSGCPKAEGIPYEEGER